MVNERLAFYRIDPHRSKEAFGKLVRDWNGILVSDGRRDLGEKAVLIGADLCVLREPEETALCQVIMRKTGLARGQILLNWSHTHSGPMIGDSDLNRYPVSEEDLPCYLMGDRRSAL